VITERDTLRRDLEQVFMMLGQSFDGPHRRTDQRSRRWRAGVGVAYHVARVCENSSPSGWRHMAKMLDALAKSDDRHHQFHKNYAQCLGHVFNRLERRMACHDQVSEAIIECRALVRK
jgi:hypothetical protein